VDRSTPGRQLLVVPVIQTREHLFKNCRNGKANKRPSGRPSWKRLESSLAQPGARTAEGGEEGASKASEWEDREHEEQLALLKEEEEERFGGEE